MLWYSNGTDNKSELEQRGTDSTDSCVHKLLFLLQNIYRVCLPNKLLLPGFGARLLMRDGVGELLFVSKDTVDNLYNSTECRT